MTISETKMNTENGEKLIQENVGSDFMIVKNCYHGGQRMNQLSEGNTSFFNILFCVIYKIELDKVLIWAGNKALF